MNPLHCSSSKKRQLRRLCFLTNHSSSKRGRTWYPPQLLMNGYKISQLKEDSPRPFFFLNQPIKDPHLPILGSTEEGLIWFDPYNRRTYIHLIKLHESYVSAQERSVVCVDEVAVPRYRSLPPALSLSRVSI